MMWCIWVQQFLATTYKRQERNPIKHIFVSSLTNEITTRYHVDWNILFRKGDKCLILNLYCTMCNMHCLKWLKKTLFFISFISFIFHANNNHNNNKSISINHFWPTVENQLWISYSSNKYFVWNRVKCMLCRSYTLFIWIKWTDIWKRRTKNHQRTMQSITIMQIKPHNHRENHWFYCHFVHFIITLKYVKEMSI